MSARNSSSHLQIVHEGLSAVNEKLSILQNNSFLAKLIIVFTAALAILLASSVEAFPLPKSQPTSDHKYFFFTDSTGQVQAIGVPMVKEDNPYRFNQFVQFPSPVPGKSQHVTEIADCKADGQGGGVSKDRPHIIHWSYLTLLASLLIGIFMGIMGYDLIDRFLEFLWDKGTDLWEKCARLGKKK